MKRCVTGLIVCSLVLGVASVASAQGVAPDVSGIVAADSTPVRWQSWVSRHAPVALVVWASWLPRSKAALTQLEPLRKVCRQHGFHLVVADVSETLAQASSALAGLKVPWIHDRHGSLLKHYRLVRIPCLLILDGTGQRKATLDVSAAALEAWEKR